MKNIAKIIGSGLLLASVSTVQADQVILDDLIVDGSICAGFDCVNGESFGFDTIRIKENNLRIRAVDTSTSASFPTRDWQITFNDSSNGGANKFSIDDIDGGRTPLTIEGNAPSHSLYVDDGGRLGLGLSTPVTDIHVRSGNTPTLRLEQDGTSGFTPQTWDVAGNEAGFFIRDATNGSTLPFRIRPGAASSSIDIAASGNVGIGASSPQSNLDIRGATPEVRLTGTDAGEEWEMRMNSAGRLNFQVIGSGNNVMQIDPQANDNLLQVGRNAADEVTVTGNLVITGSCTAGGVACDGVFSPDYGVPSIDEHAAFMWENSYLPAVGATSDGPTSINVFQKTTGILNELEKAHIYIEQLHKRLEALEAAFAQ